MACGSLAVMSDPSPLPDRRATDDGTCHRQAGGLEEDGSREETASRQPDGDGIGRPVISGGARPAVMIGFSELSGYFRNLRDGLSDLGYPCDFIELVEHPYHYSDWISPPGSLSGLVRSVRRRRELTGSAIARKGLFILAALLMVPFFLQSLLRYQVFIFTSANSFFYSNLDLILLRLAGKRVIMPFLGSEVRPLYLDGFLDYPDESRLTASNRRKKWKVQFIEQYADVIVNNPATGHYLTRPFVNFFSLGIPLSPDAVPPRSEEHIRSEKRLPATAPGNQRPVRILHAPSDRAGKGSAIIRDTVRRLMERGYAIEYTELTGRPHAEVIENVRSADMVVDQVYADTPMAVFPSEAAWFGVPAVVGGYYSETIDRDVAPDDKPPSLFVVPDMLEPAVESLIRDAELRRELGLAAFRFVHIRWTRKEVASRYARLIEGDVPLDWWFDPGSTTYLYGCGLPESEVRSRVRAAIDAGGPEALGLGDKQALVRAYRRIALGDWQAEARAPPPGEGGGA